MYVVQLVHYPYEIQYWIFFKHAWHQIEAIIEQFMVVDVGMVNTPPQVFLDIKTNMGSYFSFWFPMLGPPYPTKKMGSKDMM